MNKNLITRNSVQKFKQKYKNGGLIRKFQNAGILERPKDYLELNKPIWKKEYDNGIQYIPEIVVTGKKRYQMMPEDQLSFINTVTGGVLNRLSATQNARVLYDLGKTVSGNMSISDFGKSLIEGNNGVVTDKFAKEHPYISTGINLGLDIGVPYGAYKGTKYIGIKNSNRKYFDILENENNRNFQDLNIQNLLQSAKDKLSNFYRSPDYKRRMSEANFSSKEQNQLIEELEDLLNKTEFAGIESNPKATASAYIEYVGDNLYPKLKINPKNFQTEEDLIQSIIHELFHTSSGTYSIEKGFEQPLDNIIKTKYPMIHKAMTYNKTIQPELDDILDIINKSSKEEALSRIQKLYPYMSNEYIEKLYNQFKPEMDNINRNLNNTQEIRSRAGVTEIVARDKGWNSSHMVANPNMSSNPRNTQNLSYFNDKRINFQKKFLSWPLILGGTVYGNNQK